MDVLYVVLLISAEKEREGRGVCGGRGEPEGQKKLTPKRMYTLVYPIK